MERVESRVISNAFKKLSFHIWIYLFLVVIVAVYVRVGRTHRVSIPICHLFDFFGVFVRFQVLFFEYLLELIDVLFYRWNRKCLIQINAHKYAQGQPEHLSGNQMFKYPILVVGTLSPRRGPSWPSVGQTQSYYTYPYTLLLSETTPYSIDIVCGTSFSLDYAVHTDILICTVLL